MLTAATEIELARQSEALEKQTTDQLVVVTVASLQGKDIAGYSTELANRLGVGRADKDNGVLLVVAPNEREVRIAVGYGLEGLLTDQRAGAIVDEMLPLFRAGNSSEAIQLGVRRVDETLRGDRRRPQYKLREAA